MKAKHYVIPKGFHYCINFFPKIFKVAFLKSEEVKVVFTEESKYAIAEEECVNKLCGFCYGLFGVHKNSDRLGWAYNVVKDIFEIYSYSYDNGKLVKKVIDRVPVNTEVTYRLSVFFKDIDRYVSIRKDHGMKNISLRRYSKVTNKFGFTLGPYFGGKTRAPHKITIITL